MFWRKKLKEPSASTLIQVLREELNEILNRPKEIPPVFVCALIEGYSRDGKLRCCGISGVSNCQREVLLETQCMVPMKDIRVIVFADLRRVAIHGIFCGIDLATVAIGECPVAYFDEWNPGQKLRIQCLVR